MVTTVGELSLPCLGVFFLGENEFILSLQGGGQAEEGTGALPTHPSVTPDHLLESPCNYNVVFAPVCHWLSFAFAVPVLEHGASSC